MTDISVRAGLHAEYIETTGAVLAGRDGFDSAIGDSRPYGGAWEGPIFVLTHHPEDARQSEGVTILSCPVNEARPSADSPPPSRRRRSHVGGERALPTRHNVMG